MANDVKIIILNLFLSQVQLLLYTLILVTVLVLHCLIWYSVLGMSLHSYHVNIAMYTATTIIIILIIIVMMLASDVQVCITYSKVKLYSLSETDCFIIIIMYCFAIGTHLYYSTPV